MPAQIGIDIAIASALLRQGKLVAIPTETVYGLAANGLDSKSVLGIFEAKNRPTFDPLILHVRDIPMAKTLVNEWNDTAQTLAEAFWPGPLTLILPKSDIVPDLVTAGNTTVAIRIPSHPLTLALLHLIEFPLAAPSANPFSYVSPTTAKHVADQLIDRVDYILDGGECTIGIESTILAIEGKTAKVLRLGGLSIEAIETVLGQPLLETLQQNSNPQSPGQLDHHYAPRCKLIPLYNKDEPQLYWAELLKKPLFTSGFGLLLFSKQGMGAEEEFYLTKLQEAGKTKVYILDELGDMAKAGAKLFSILRLLDSDGCKEVYFSWAPEIGLGRAINDRLMRASS